MYLKTAKYLLSQFNETEIKQIPREENIHEDALSNIGSSVQTKEQKTIPLVFLKWLALWKVQEKENSKLAHKVTWITPLFDYIHNDLLPDDQNET